MFSRFETSSGGESELHRVAFELILVQKTIELSTEEAAVAVSFRNWREWSMSIECEKHVMGECAIFSTLRIVFGFSALIEQRSRDE